MAATDLPASVSQILPPGLAALALPDTLAAPLLAYLALLQRWNRAYNLTAIRDPQTMVTRHLLDSLVLLPHLGDIHTLADLGTGPGLPGIPLALARPGLQVTLVEANGKKARFLREAVRTLELDNADVIHARIEDVRVPTPFDAITARALGTLPGILSWGGHLLAGHGQVLAMKGVVPAQEIAALPARWQVQALHPLTVPGLEEERHLIILTRAPHPKA